MAYRVLSPSALKTPSRSTPGILLLQTGRITTWVPEPKIDVRGALAGVIDPELGDSVIDLGMVRSIDIDDGTVTVTVALTTAGCPLRAQFMKDVRARVGALVGVNKVNVKFGEMTAEQKRTLMDRARFKAQERSTLRWTCRPRPASPRSRRARAASARAPSRPTSRSASRSRGFKVGVLDADIGGFSMPRLLGVDAKVEAEKADGDRVRITPVEKHDRRAGCCASCRWVRSPAPKRTKR